MRTTYTRGDRPGMNYDIEADRHGSYAIRLNGKVIKRVSALPSYVGRPRWGSRKLEADAIEDAKKAIDAMPSGGN